MSNLLLASSLLNHTQQEIWRYAVVTTGVHTVDTHDMGFIMNQQVLNVGHKQINEIYNLKQALPKCPVYCGGPVMTERCTLIHSNDYKNTDTRLFNPHCSLTFNDAIIEDINKGVGPREWKVMLGHCQWHDGQLDAEIHRPGGWLQQPWHGIAWGGYRRKEKMWRRLVEIETHQDAHTFLDSIWENHT